MIIDHLRATPTHRIVVHLARRYVKTCLFGSTKWFLNFWHSIFAHQSLTPAVDWLDAWIGQGGLLLLVSYLLLFWFYYG
jgi:hypothetical protein